MEEISLEKILPAIEKLNTDCQESGACVLDRETFLKIYQLEKYRRERRLPSSYIMQIKLKDSGKEDVKLEKADGLMLDILKAKIRGGDAICHWDQSHFIILLYDIKKEEIKTVYNRIEFFFYTNYKEPEEIKLIFNTA